MTEIARKTIAVGAEDTSYLEAGQGDPVVLFHSGEFGVSAEVGWRRSIGTGEYDKLLPPGWAAEIAVHRWRVRCVEPPGQRGREAGQQGRG